MRRPLILSGILLLFVGYGLSLGGINDNLSRTPGISPAGIEWPDPIPLELPTTGDMIARLGTGQFCSVELSPDKSRLAAISGVGLFMFDAYTFDLIWFIDTSDTPESIHFNADGTKLAMVESGGTITLLDASTGRSIRHFSMKDYAPIEVAWSPDGRLITAKGYLPETLVWDVETGELVWELPGYTEYSHRLVFSPDSRLLVSSQGGYEYRSDIVVWEMASGEEILHEEQSIADYIVFDENNSPQFYSHGMFHVLAWSQDGLLLAQPNDVEQEPDALRATVYEIVNNQTGEQISTFEPPPSRYSLAFAKQFSPNNDYLLGWYSTDDKVDYLAVWDVSTGELAHNIPADIMFSSSSQWDGQVFYTITRISEVNHIVAWDIEQGIPIRMIAGTPAVESLGWKDATLFVKTGDEIYQWKDGVISASAEYTVTPKTYSPDSMLYIALDSEKDLITIHDARTDEALYSIDDPVGTFRDFAWSPDSGHLAIAAAGEIIIWDVAQHMVNTRLFGHTDIVSSVDWSPYGLASGSWDGSVKIWDVSTGEVLQTFVAHNGYVSAVSWSFDGLLASGSEDGAAIIWKTE
jgi:WD40 repeat protein